MKIENTKVYGLKESISCMKYSFDPKHELGDTTEKEEQIAKKLGKAQSGSGHDCYLKGIIVQMDITAPHYWLPQFQRYHWMDFVMSQSKMHNLLQFDLDEQCTEYVLPTIKEILNNLIAQYNDDIFEEKEKKEIWKQILANTPLGFMLKARMTTNYMQLKTIYHQRRKHKLNEWHIFCDWIRNLPKFNELVLGE